MKNIKPNRFRNALPGVYIAISMLLVSCTSTMPVTRSASEEVYQLANIYVEQFYLHHPELATIRGITDYDHSSITDLSSEATTRWAAVIDSLHNQIKRIDTTHFEDHQTWLLYNRLNEELEGTIQTRICREELWDVSYLSGWQIGIGHLAGIQPVGTEHLRDQALKRFSGISEYVDQHIQNLRRGLKMGYSSPQSVVERVIDQIDAIQNVPIEYSPMYSPARRDTATEFQEDFTRLIRDSVGPVLVRYQNFLKNEYLSQAREERSIMTIPEGKACYRAILRKKTTLDLTPEYFHQAGLRMIDSIKTELQYLQTSILDSQEHDHASSSAGPFNVSDPSVITRISNETIERARGALSGWFHNVSLADIAIVPMTPDQETVGIAGTYVNAAEDGSRPAQYFLNINSIDSRADAENMVFHEGIPGHHLQRSLAIQNEAGHPITRYFGFDIYNEGWGTYAEYLAGEMGLYTSVQNRIEFLEDLLGKAVIMTTETGLNGLGWTSRQANNFYARLTNAARNQSTYVIDILSISHGQQLPYLIGYQEILQLRNKAEMELGDEFEIAEFHDVVLRDGSVPLPILKENVERWISSH